MNEYFRIQFNRLNRKVNEIGFTPILTYILVTTGFYVISIYLFSKMEFAKYFYGLISLHLISRLSEKRRNDFIKTIFSNNSYRKIRIIENLILALPFLIFLLYKQFFFVSTLLILPSVLLALFSFNNSLNFSIPTPFSNKPFEFTSGFRKTYWGFPFAYFLTYQAIRVENFNLGIFSILLITTAVLSFYLKPENDYFVWSFSLSPKEFLMSKIKTGLLYSTALSSPVFIALGIFFPNETTTVIVILFISYLYLVTIVLAKYSAYPNEMNIPEGIVIGVSLMFPPILLAVIPFFYTKSINQLNLVLEND